MLGFSGRLRQYFSLYRAGVVGWCGGGAKGGRGVRWCWVNFQRRGRPTILITVGQGPTASAVGAGGVVWTFLHSSILFFSIPSLWETARYRLKYRLKWAVKPKTTNYIGPSPRDSRVVGWCEGAG